MAGNNFFKDQLKSQLGNEISKAEKLKVSWDGKENNNENIDKIESLTDKPKKKTIMKSICIKENHQDMLEQMRFNGFDFNMSRQMQILIEKKYEDFLKLMSKK